MADDTLQTPGAPGGVSATTVEPAKIDPQIDPESPTPRRRSAADEARSSQEAKGVHRRHKVLIAIGVLLAIIAGTAGYWWWLNHQLSSIPRFNAGITVPEGKNGGGEQNKPLDILLLGADHGSVDQSRRGGAQGRQVDPLAHRSDTIMVFHIPADRKSVQLVSIPRDSWVDDPRLPVEAGTREDQCRVRLRRPRARVSRPSRTSPASRSTTSRSSTGSASET